MRLKVKRVFWCSCSSHHTLWLATLEKCASVRNRPQAESARAMSSWACSRLQLVAQETTRNERDAAWQCQGHAGPVTQRNFSDSD